MSGNDEQGARWLSSSSVAEALCVQCKQPQYASRDVNCDNAISVANWKTGLDAGSFDGDFGGMFFGDEHSTFHHNLWTKTTDVTPLSPLLSTSTPTCIDESGMYILISTGQVASTSYAALP